MVSTRLHLTDCIVLHGRGTLPGHGAFMFHSLYVEEQKQPLQGKNVWIVSIVDLLIMQASCRVSSPLYADAVVTKALCAGALHLVRE